MFSTNDLNSKNMKIEKISYKDILIYYIGYQTLDGVIHYVLC